MQEWTKMLLSTEMELSLAGAPCPIVRFNALIHGKYKLRILWELRAIPRRYSEIQRALITAAGGGTITPRVLSRELRALADSRLIARKQYPVVPPRVEYRLTEDGRALLGVMRAVCRWGEIEASRGAPRRRPAAARGARALRA
ncbi:MAG: transcriptional regulator [Myxococcales bacterium]|nr:transcriptional regulator [Myxococcales bacterium]